MSKTSPKSICSAAFSAGRLHSSSQAGPPTDLFGQPVAHAPRSARPAKSGCVLNAQRAVLCRALDALVSSYAALASTHGLPTPATYGRKPGGSSPSADLQSGRAGRKPVWTFVVLWSTRFAGNTWLPCWGRGYASCVRRLAAHPTTHLVGGRRPRLRTGRGDAAHKGRTKEKSTHLGTIVEPSGVVHASSERRGAGTGGEDRAGSCQLK